MGKVGVRYGSSDTKTPVTMQDLMQWWEQVEGDSGRRVQFLWQLVPGVGGLRASIIAQLVEVGLEPHPTVVAQRSLQWPTSSHKTVLGAMVWLLITLDDIVDADAALAAIAAPGE